MSSYPEAWALNPPAPGDRDYAAYVLAQPAERERLRKLAESIVGPELAELVRIPDPSTEPDFEHDPRTAEQQVADLRAAPLAACLTTFREWLHLPDPGALYVTLATVAANRAAGDPVWLLVVGPPGGGKTEIINAIAGEPDVHPAATLTEGALLSGVPRKDHASNAKGGLLREIGDFGIVLHKDFGSVLSMNRDTRAAVLAALREVYDGSWTRHVGTDGGRTLSWTGKVALVAGCTPSIDSHHAVVGSMGERFVLYRLPTTDADQQVRRALGHAGREGAMRRQLADAVRGVLARVDAERLAATADDETTDRLVRIATLAVRCRSAVERDGYTREVTLIPEAEAPARLALVLLRLLNGLGAIGVDDGTAWALVRKCALDSMPAVRRTVLEVLVAREDAVSTTDIAESVDYPTTTARRALEDLTAHGIAERATGGPGRPDVWRMTGWARGRWPTVPEMSVGRNSAAGSVPEMSDNPSAEHENGVEPSLFSLPLRVVVDKSGTLPAWDPENATDADAAEWRRA